jgi:hypothetical protein
VCNNSDVHQHFLFVSTAKTIAPMDAVIPVNLAMEGRLHRIISAAPSLAPSVVSATLLPPPPQTMHRSPSDSSAKLKVPMKANNGRYGPLPGHGCLTADLRGGRVLLTTCAAGCEMISMWRLTAALSKHPIADTHLNPNSSPNTDTRRKPKVNSGLDAGMRGGNDQLGLITVPSNAGTIVNTTERGKLLCWIQAHAATLQSRGAAVRDTWGV